LLKRLTSLAVALSLAIATTAPATAQSRSPGVVRDAEVEGIIRAYATPLFEAAGLNAADIRIFLINDDRLNAFVAGGMNLFLNTGLLMRAEKANQVIGVIAHETGHIAGGHLARTQEALSNASTEAIIAFVLGMAVAAAGQGEAGTAIIGGGATVAQADLLKYSRTQESAADHAGVSYLDSTGQSSRGLLEFFEILEGQELMLSGRQDPYLRTHPLSSDRIDFVRHHIEGSPFSDAAEPAGFTDGFGRMRAKLIGFLRPLNRVLQDYPESDGSLDGRYARSIGYYRAGQLDKALPLLDGLIAEHPEDPFFQELKGQILMENGRGREAIPYYEESVRLAPHEPLLRVGLAQVLIDTEDPGLNRDALINLEEVTRIEPRNGNAWRLLSIAYGRDGQIPMTALALAEAALLRGDNSEAWAQADRAMQQLPEGSPAWLRAQDIQNTADRNKDKQ
jgi:predicted Zn-dependent protease